MEVTKDIQFEMVQEFQCPGCGMSSDDPCIHYNIENDNGRFRCKNHHSGTIIGYGHFMRKVALGLPVGFNKGFELDQKSVISLYVDPNDFKLRLDNFNIAFWALEQNGYLFIRIYQPRLNVGMVDVIKGGKREEICPNALDVATFIDQID